MIHDPRLFADIRTLVDNLVPMVLEELIEQGIVPEHWKTGFDA